MTRLAYFEWSADPGCDHADPNAWAEANPALGIRITDEFIATELGALDPDDFARERLGIYPEDLDATETVIDEAAWKACLSPSSAITGPVFVAFEVSVDRRWSAIAVAGTSTHGGLHVEVRASERKTGWVVERLKDLKAAHPSITAIACNPSGPAGGLVAEAKKAGLDLVELKGTELSQACAAAYDDITEGRWRHLGQPVLDVAVHGATKRPMGDSWVFDRRGATDISPLIAVTLAAQVARQPAEAEGPPNLW